MGTTREQLAAEITQAVSEFQDATDELDDAGADLLGVNRTDLRCLSLLSRRGAMTAGQLAADVDLTTGATTTAVDRLARKGYVERVHDGQDRRRVAIRITPAAAARIEQVWGPLGRESKTLLMRRSKAELEAILDFLREGTRFQAEHVDRIHRGA